jgi:cytochrome P450
MKSRSAAACWMLASPLPLVPIAFDPPEQTRYRRILQPFFSPRAIRPLEGDLRRQLSAIIEPLAARGECDFVAEVVGIFPVQAFLTLFGFPLDMRDQLIEWKDAVLGLTDASGNTALDGAAAEAAMGKAGELFLYLSDLVARRRGAAGDDVLNQLLVDDPSLIPAAVEEGSPARLPAVGRAMRATIDRDRCAGHGLCSMLGAGVK